MMRNRNARNRWYGGLWRGTRCTGIALACLAAAGCGTLGYPSGDGEYDDSSFSFDLFAGVPFFDAGYVVEDPVFLDAGFFDEGFFDFGFFDFDFFDPGYVVVDDYGDEVIDLGYDPFWDDPSWDDGYYEDDYGYDDEYDDDGAYDEYDDDWKNKHPDA